MLTSLIIAGSCALLALFGVISVKYLGQNNPVETAVEAVIGDETGSTPNLNAEAASMGITGSAPKGPTAPAA